MARAIAAGVVLFGCAYVAGLALYVFWVVQVGR